MNIFNKLDAYRKEICDSRSSSGMGDIDMCPQCDQSCTYWKLKTSCLFSRITYIFDNEATTLFAVFMSLWGIHFNLMLYFSSGKLNTTCKDPFTFLSYLFPGTLEKKTGCITVQLGCYQLPK